MADVFGNQPELINMASACFDRKESKFSSCLKGCKWSPDGTCIAVNSEDHCLRLFNMPADGSAGEMRPELELFQSQIIYDYAWFPSMDSNDCATCFLLCTSKNMPIQLMDAYGGKTTATYFAHNYADELVSSRCVCFIPSGQTFFAGYDKFIASFDIQKPGTFKDQIANISPGIVSCLASSNELLVTGSYNKCISLYDVNTLEHITDLQGQKGGVTHLLVSPDGKCLYSGGRKDNEILVWDVRNLGSIMHVINRQCSTHQRIYFDVHFEHNILASGDDTGQVSLHDLNQSNQIFRFKSNESCVNCVDFHPTLPLVATTSGQRVMVEFDENNEDLMFNWTKSYKADHNLKLWWFTSKQASARVEQLGIHSN